MVNGRDHQPRARAICRGATLPILALMPSKMLGVQSKCGEEQQRGYDGVALLVALIRHDTRGVMVGNINNWGHSTRMRNASPTRPSTRNMRMP